MRLVVLHLRKLSLNLPWGIGGVEVEITQAQANAAWALYVEFATRVSAAPLEPGTGSIREALDSLYTLFGATREVLRSAGPDAAHGRNSLGPLVIRALNDGLRPFVVKWHTEWRRASREAGASWDDGSWDRAPAFYDELARLTSELASLVENLARIANVAD
jgi:hypothetical protein